MDENQEKPFLVDIFAVNIILLAFISNLKEDRKVREDFLFG